MTAAQEKAGVVVTVQAPADRRSYWWLVVTAANGAVLSRTSYARKVDALAAKRAMVSAQAVQP